MWKLPSKSHRAKNVPMSHRAYEPKRASEPTLDFKFVIKSTNNQSKKTKVEYVPLLRYNKNHAKFQAKTF